MHTWIQGITTPGHEITLKGEEEGGGGVRERSWGYTSPDA